MTGLFVALDHVRNPGMLQGLTPPERHVLLALATYTDRAGDAAPTMAGLADLTGYAERSVYRIVDRLVSKGRVIKRRGGGRGNPSRFIVAGPPWLEVVHNPDPPSVIEGQAYDVTLTETLTETLTPRSGLGEGEGVVLTNRDSDRRANGDPFAETRPWVLAGMKYGEWVRQDRDARRAAR